MDAIGAVAAVSIGYVVDAIGAVGVIGGIGCVVAMSISRRSWLCVVIDACSFNRQLRLLIIWPCLWHAEHIGSCFIGSSLVERIRPIWAVCKFPVCCLRACSGSRSGRKVLLRS